MTLVFWTMLVQSDCRQGFIQMQTFLPYPNFIASAMCLDVKRLGKQRLEARQILKVLDGKSLGWKNHPAVRMWTGYAPAIRLYGDCVIREWLRRGYSYTVPLECTPDETGVRLTTEDVELPPWLGDERLHSSHRSRLLQKDPVWYGQFEWTESPSEENYWPVRGET